MAGFARLTTNGQGGAGFNGAARLGKIVVGAASTGATLTIYNASYADSGNVFQVLSLASVGMYDYSGVVLPRGLFLSLTGASDVIVTFD